MPDLAFRDQLLDRPCYIFDWYVRIDSVLIEQIDNISLESLERSVGNVFDVRWVAVDAYLLSFGTEFETKFCSYHHLITERCESFTHKFLIGEWAIRFSSVEECDAAFDCR